ncbi:MAG: SRPBCC family protein, partial [Bacteroidales bacterium]|nr:SRPBCC family protein [Bacteroidales bacterium]
MKALKIIGIVLLILVALFFIIAIFLPKSVFMQKSIVIDKPASLIFKQVNNYQNWSAWSPWEANDPDMVSHYEGPAMGVGAKTIWTSAKHGDGSMTITESIPYKRVASSLDFGQNGEAFNYFEFEESDEGTLVTWGVDVPDMGYPGGRYIALLMPGMMEPFFNEGLNRLKEVTESMPEPPALQLAQMPEMNVISIMDSCSWSDLNLKMAELFGELAGFMKTNRLEHAGYPMSCYYKWDEENQFTVFENCIPVNKEVSGRGRVQFRTMPGVLAVMGTHFGAYDETMYMYVAMDEFVSEFGLETVG